MTIRYGSNPIAEEDEMGDETIWYMTDSLSNGRWLHVDHPDHRGHISIGIAGVYTKYLSSEAARAFAAAIIEAADEADES